MSWQTSPRPTAGRWPRSILVAANEPWGESGGDLICDGKTIPVFCALWSRELWGLGLRFAQLRAKQPAEKPCKKRVEQVEDFVRQKFFKPYFYLSFVCEMEVRILQILESLSLG